MRVRVYQRLWIDFEAIAKHEIESDWMVSGSEWVTRNKVKLIVKVLDFDWLFNWY